MHFSTYILATDSSIADAVPIKERLDLPNNEPAPPPDQGVRAPIDPQLPILPGPNPDDQQSHILIAPEDINPLLQEIYQKPYIQGLRKDKAPAERISYFPDGFTVARVLDGDFSEIVDAENQIPTFEGQSWPQKTAFHLEFFEPAYNKRMHGRQRRVPRKKGDFAKHTAEEIQKMLAEMPPEFPFGLNQIKVVSVDVRSRGTVQARLFVSREVLAAMAQ